MTTLAELTTTGVSIATLIGMGVAAIQWARGFNRRALDEQGARIAALELKLVAIEREQGEAKLRAAFEENMLTDIKASMTRNEDRLHRLVESRNGHA